MAAFADNPGAETGISNQQPSLCLGISMIFEFENFWYFKDYWNARAKRLPSRYRLPKLQFGQALDDILSKVVCEKIATCFVKFLKCNDSIALCKNRLGYVSGSLCDHKQTDVVFAPLERNLRYTIQ